MSRHGQTRFAWRRASTPAGGLKRRLAYHAVSRRRKGGAHIGVARRGRRLRRASALQPRRSRPRNPVASTYISRRIRRGSPPGFTWRTVAKSRLSVASSSPSVPPCRPWRRKTPPGASTSTANCAAASASADDAQMVGLVVAGRVGRHVGHHDVGRAAQHRLQPLRRVLVEEVHLHEFDARDRVDVEEVDADHPALPAPAVQPCVRAAATCAPAAGRGAEVDHALRRASAAV